VTASVRRPRGGSSAPLNPPLGGLTSGFDAFKSSPRIKALSMQGETQGIPNQLRGRDGVIYPTQNL